MSTSWAEPDFENSCKSFRMMVVDIYRASTITGHTVYFTKLTQDIWECVILEFFHAQNILNTKPNSQCRKN